MLSREDNALITETGQGSPMGELFRRFWLPALLPDELAEPDSAPVRTRILGEDLVAFRDTDGVVGFVGLHCPHRGASLFFGRNEESGLRCVYHGWKFDVSGKCVDMPNEPPESNFKEKVRVAAYPSAEWGGFIWIYMGPPELKPALPQLEWARVPAEQRHVGRWTHESNYLQSMEGDIDSSHSMFLHSATDPFYVQTSRRFGVLNDVSPRLSVQETQYGFAYGGRYNTVGTEFNWRVTQWLLPTHTMIATKQFPIGGRVYVPVDNEHTNVFNYRYNPERPMNETELEYYNSGRSSPPASTRCALRLRDGAVIDTWRPNANRDNDYGIDRERQRTQNYSGIHGIHDQDRAVTESMGRVMDRTRERLGTTDVAIISARRRLIRLARELRHGAEPYAASHGDVYHVRSLDAVSDQADLSKLLKEQEAALSARV